MQPTRNLPQHIVVRANDSRAEGVAIRLCFEMNYKNDFYYPLFLGQGGTAEVTVEELLRYFEVERSLALMDYVDPQAGFTGKVTAAVMSDDELQRAVEASKLFGRYAPYPNGYEANLLAAVKRSQNPNEFNLELEIA